MTDTDEFFTTLSSSVTILTPSVASLRAMGNFLGFTGKLRWDAQFLGFDQLSGTGHVGPIRWSGCLTTDCVGLTAS